MLQHNLSEQMRNHLGSQKSTFWDTFQSIRIFLRKMKAEHQQEVRLREKGKILV